MKAPGGTWGAASRSRQAHRAAWAAAPLNPSCHLVTYGGREMTVWSETSPGRFSPSGPAPPPTPRPFGSRTVSSGARPAGDSGCLPPERGGGPEPPLSLRPQDGEKVSYDSGSQSKYSKQQMGNRHHFLIYDLWPEDAGIYQVKVEDADVFSTELEAGSEWAPRGSAGGQSRWTGRARVGASAGAGETGRQWLREHAPHAPRRVRLGRLLFQSPGSRSGWPRGPARGRAQRHTH